MTHEEAKRILKYHSFTDEDINHPKMENRFLGMLRPFSGKLNEESYHEVIKAIRTLADELRNKEKIDREVISAIWGICHLTRSWAIEKEGMLRRNNLINDEQIKKLEKWVESISYATMMILDGNDNSTAFELYENE
ncbi:MAG: hypothetical protein AAFO07_26605 [Bacteroidota bacterium]